MTAVAHVAGLLACVYVVFTLSSTGWAKLASVHVSSARLRGEVPWLGSGSSRTLVVLLASTEILLAAAASSYRSTGAIAVACAALFLAFASYNIVSELRGHSGLPCLCAGGTASASSGYARAAANVVCAAMCGVWAAFASEPVPGLSVALWLAWVVSPAVWAVRAFAGARTRARLALA